MGRTADPPAGSGGLPIDRRPLNRSAPPAAGRGLIDRVPLWVLLAIPGLVVLAVTAITPESVRPSFALDVDIYRGYAVDLLRGGVLYRDVPLEYPALAIIPMLLPLVGAPAEPGALDYLWRFAAIEAALAAGVGWLVYRLSGRSRRALGLWAVLAGLSWVAIALRYDIWPVAFSVLGLVLAPRRPGAAGVALGLGTMLKLYPVVVLPIVALHAVVRRDWHGLVRLGTGWAGAVGLVMAAAWAMAGPDSLDWLRYQGDRGLQVESVGASLLMGLHLLTGHPVQAGFGFGSVQLVSPGADLLVAAMPVVLVALLGLVLVLTARRFRADQAALGEVPVSSVALSVLAAITALLVGSKVLSFQYAVWLLPFVPLLPVRGRWAGLAIAGLSTWIYTWDYMGLWHFQPEMMLALIARNALLVGFGAWLLRRLWLGPRVV